jgi:PIN domain nuclease of toxin-antitoxin system
MLKLDVTSIIKKINLFGTCDARSFQRKACHTDPFDRLLVVKALAEGLPLVGKYTTLCLCESKLFW